MHKQSQHDIIYTNYVGVSGDGNNQDPNSIQMLVIELETIGSALIEPKLLSTSISANCRSLVP